MYRIFQQIILVLSVSVILNSIPASAQFSKSKYSGGIEFAALNGTLESNFAINMSHGVSIGKWNAAIGTGIDYYRFRSLPLYVDLKRSIPVGKALPFFQCSAGLNVAWPTSEQKMTQKLWSSWWPQTDTMSFSNGFYSRFVAGIIFNPKSAAKIGATLGWSYKSVTTSNDELVFTGTGTSSELRTNIYRMNRLYIGLGISF